VHEYTATTISKHPMSQISNTHRKSITHLIGDVFRISLRWVLMSKMSPG
jgi:hypothetical protein